MLTFGAWAITARAAPDSGELDAALDAFRGGRWQEARDRLRVLVEEEPDSAVLRFDLASAEFKLDQLADAALDYLGAASDPHLAPLATLDAGLAVDGLGLEDSARALWLQAAALDPGGPVDDEAHRLLDALASDQRADRRRAAFRLARAGVAALKSGEVRSSVQTLLGALDEARAADLAPSDRAEIARALARAWLADGHPREALRVLDEHPAATSDAEGRALRAQAHDLLAPAPAPSLPRVTALPEVSLGYDSHYAGGREVLFMNGVRTTTATGAPFVSFALDPRVRLVGRPSNGAYVGTRLDGLLYLTGDAYPFSLIEGALWADGSITPTKWLTLTGAVQGWVDVEGVMPAAGAPSLGWYQTGAQLWARATFWEGDAFATRVRYAQGFIDALDPSYSYLSGTREEATATELYYVGSWRIAGGYAYRHEGVGMQTVSAATVLPQGPDLELRCLGDLHRRCVTLAEAALLSDSTYTIPWAYDGHELRLDGDGDLPWGLHLTAGFTYQRRNYLGAVAITPDPAEIVDGTLQHGVGYHKTRNDDRFSFDLELRRAIGAGIELGLSLYLLVSRSTIDNTATGYSFDFDDKNFLRFVGSLDVSRPF